MPEWTKAVHAFAWQIWLAAICTFVASLVFTSTIYLFVARRREETTYGRGPMALYLAATLLGNSTPFLDGLKLVS